MRLVMLLLLLVVCSLAGCTESGATVNGSCHQRQCKSGDAPTVACPFDDMSGECDGPPNCTGSLGMLNCGCYQGLISGETACLCALRPGFNLD